MPSYRQTYIFHEDDYGPVRIVFVISDTHNGLFTSTPDADTDLFTLEDVDKSLEIKEGVQIDQQLTFRMNALYIENATDQTIFDFVLDAKDSNDPTKRRFTGVFLDPPNYPTLATDDLEFSGVIQPKMSFVDLKWSDGQWGSAQDPPREWKITSKPFFADLFDQISVKDLIYGIGQVGDSNYVPKISTTWETANLTNDIGYFSGNVFPMVGTLRETRWMHLVYFDDVVCKIRDNLIAGLAARGLGTFTINFIESTVDPKFSPARFVHNVFPAGNLPEAHFRYLNTIPDPFAFTVEPNDAHEVRLFSSNSQYKFKISYYVIKPLFDTNPTGVSVDWGWEKIKTFTDLLYEIAYSFGMFVQFDYTDAVTLNIKFITRKSLKKHRVYIKDVSRKPEGDTDIIPASDKKVYFANANWLCTDSTSEYLWDDVNGIHTRYPLPAREGKDLLLCVAVTLREIIDGQEGNYKIGGGERVIFPHACTFYNAGVPMTDNNHDARGLTRAIFLCAPAINEYGLTGQTITAPAAMVSANIDGVEKTWQTLSGYINDITARDTGYFDTEYKFTALSLCGFRKSADGSHLDDRGGKGNPRNLDLGCTYYIDANEYAIIGYKKQLRKPRVEIRAQLSSRFAFADVVGPVTQQIIAAPVDRLAVNIINRRSEAIERGEDIYFGDVVTKRSDGKIYRAQSIDADYGMIFGVDEAGGAAGTSGQITLPPAMIYHPQFEFDPGQKIYLRTTAYGTPNADFNRLSSNTETENYFVEIGSANDGGSYFFELGMEFIFPPYL